MKYFCNPFSGYLPSLTKLALIALAFSSGPLKAQDVTVTTTTVAQCTNPDRYGWGWNGSFSCYVPSYVPVAGTCVDSDGDGWGWDGVKSCKISAPLCVDTDGDGWGWTGEKSCLVADGDTDNPDTDAAAMAFREQLEGVRTYGCVPGDEFNYTYEFVEIFKAGIYTYDYWLYEETECLSRPLTFTKSLPLKGYKLVEPILASDGSEAFIVEYETLQAANPVEDNANALGSIEYEIVAVQQGGVTPSTTTVATVQEARLLDLDSPFPGVPVGLRAAPATAAGLMHTWKADCFNGKTNERTFGNQQFTETISYYDDVDCAADRFYATTIATWDITYGEAVTTFFGQPALRTTIDLVESKYGSIVIGSGLPSPPDLATLPLMFDDIWGVIDDELVIGTCLDKSPGGCGSANNIPDILNFNVGNRFKKQ